MKGTETMKKRILSLALAAMMLVCAALLSACSGSMTASEKFFSAAIGEGVTTVKATEFIGSGVELSANLDLNKLKIYGTDLLGGETASATASGRVDSGSADADIDIVLKYAGEAIKANLVSAGGSAFATVDKLLDKYISLDRIVKNNGISLPVTSYSAIGGIGSVGDIEIAEGVKINNVTELIELAWNEFKARYEAIPEEKFVKSTGDFTCGKTTVKGVESISLQLGSAEIGEIVKNVAEKVLDSEQYKDLTKAIGQKSEIPEKAQIIEKLDGLLERAALSFDGTAYYNGRSFAGMKMTGSADGKAALSYEYAVNGGESSLRAGLTVKDKKYFDVTFDKNEKTLEFEAAINASSNGARIKGSFESENGKTYSGAIRFYSGEEEKFAISLDITRDGSKTGFKVKGVSAGGNVIPLTLELNLEEKSDTEFKVSGALALNFGDMINVDISGDMNVKKISDFTAKAPSAVYTESELNDENFGNDLEQKFKDQFPKISEWTRSAGNS